MKRFTTIEIEGFLTLGAPYPPFLLENFNIPKGLTVVVCDNNITARVMVVANCFSAN